MVTISHMVILLFYWFFTKIIILGCKTNEAVENSLNTSITKPLNIKVVDEQYTVSSLNLHRLFSFNSKSSKIHFFLCRQCEPFYLPIYLQPTRDPPIQLVLSDVTHFVVNGIISIHSSFPFRSAREFFVNLIEWCLQRWRRRRCV